MAITQVSFDLGAPHHRHAWFRRVSWWLLDFSAALQDFRAELREERRGYHHELALRCLDGHQLRDIGIDRSGC